MKAVHRGLGVDGVDRDERPRHDDDVDGTIAEYLIRDVQVATRCVASPRRPRTGHSHSTRLASRLLPQVRNGRLRSARPARRPAASPARDPAGRCRSAMPRRAAPVDTGESLPRNTSSSRPRTWRSVPAYRWTRRTGAAAAGYPFDRHAQTLNGHSPHRGERAVHTVAPSSIRATENVGASALSGNKAATSSRSRTDAGESARPCTTLATTRRTLVSTTGTRLR